MKFLSQLFLAVLLLTVTSTSWAACPEGTKSNYKGECVEKNIKFKSGYIQSWKNPELGTRRKFSPATLFEVTDPSVLLFVVRARADLLRTDTELNEKYCGDRSQWKPPFKLIESIGVQKLSQKESLGGQTDRPDTWKEQSTIFDSVASRFRYLISACLVEQRHSCTEIIEDINQYVEADAPKIPNPDELEYEYWANAYFTFTRLLKPSLFAYSVARDLVPTESSGNREKILQWFRTLIIRSEERFPLDYVDSCDEMMGTFIHKSYEKLGKCQI